MYNRILICPDSFKESIDSIELCQFLSEILNEFGTVSLPLADGGEGSLSIINSYLSLEKKLVQLTGPLGNLSASYYFRDPTNAIAYVELAVSSGLGKIPSEFRNPSELNTLATGMLILDAIQDGYKTIYLFLGGSSTNDAGIGIASALGFKFYNGITQIHLPKGADLINIDRIEKTKLLDVQDVKINIVHDVDNPFLGPNGAVHTFSEQKGADENMRVQLEKAMEHINSIFISTYNINVAEMKGAGAAGGIAGGLFAMLDAKLQSGLDFFCKLVDLEAAIKQANLIITGEGRIDEQSISSKLVSRICTLAKNNNKKVFTICGEITLTKEEMSQVGIDGFIELKDFGEKDRPISREQSILQLEASKKTLLKKIKEII